MPTTKASMDLCSLDQAKQHLKLEGTDEDTYIAAVINRVSLMIERWCDRKFKIQLYQNELYNGNGYPWLYLRNAPIDATYAPKIEFLYGVDQWQTQENDYLKYSDPDESGYLYFSDRRFPVGIQNVRATYRAGIASQAHALPPDLVQAAVEMVSVLRDRKELKTHLFPSVTSVDGVTQLFRDSPMPRSVIEILANYRMVSW